MKTYIGTLEFIDIGVGEWYLNTDTERYRVIPTNLRIASTLVDGANVTVTAEVPDGAVTGGTSHPILFASVISLG